MFRQPERSHHQSQENSCCQSNVLRQVRVIRLASLAVMYGVRFLRYHRTSPVPPLPHSQLSLSQHKVKNLETLMPLKTNRSKKGVVDQL